MRIFVKWTVCGAVIAFAAFVAISGWGCSSPTALREGQGVGFVAAADRAVEVRVNGTGFHYVPSGTPLSFKWDDGSVIRDGWVTISGNGQGWYIAPGQCQYAPPEACSYEAGVQDRVYTDAQFVAVAGGKDCSLWPCRCFVVGYRYAPGSGCFLNWCPLYDCQTGCPPTGSGD